MPAFFFDADSLRHQLHKVSSGEYLETVNSAKDFPNLLDLEAQKTPLGTLTFKDFTADVAVIKKSALQAGHPEKGLVVLFDIHRRIEGDVLDMAKNRLVAANVKSGESRPVVVLTDLVDDWRLLYMDGATVHEKPYESKAHAVKEIGAIIHEVARFEALDQMLPKA